MSLEGKKILITGASGFIGSHLTERLIEKGADVSVFLRYNSSNSLGMLSELPIDYLRKIKIYRGDLKNADAVKKAVQDKEIIFHLGALISIPHSYTDPREYADTNTIGTLNILQASRNEKIEKIITTSTSEVYGTAKYTPIDEEHPLQTQSPYSASKSSADRFAESFYDSYNLPVSIIRPFNTYGPRQSKRAIIPTIIFQALNQRKYGEPVKIGSLSPKRDFTYVDDTVNGFLNIAESDNRKLLGNVVNIGSGKAISIGDLAEIIGKKIGIKMNINEDSSKIRPENSEVRLLLCNNSKAKELLGWEPRINLEQGLEKTISYIEKNFEKYKNSEGEI